MTSSRLATNAGAAFTRNANVAVVLYAALTNQTSSNIVAIGGWETFLNPRNRMGHMAAIGASAFRSLQQRPKGYLALDLRRDMMVTQGVGNTIIGYNTGRGITTGNTTLTV